MTDQEIIDYFKAKSSNRIMKYKLNSLSTNDEVYIYLMNRFDDTVSLEESLYRIMNNIETIGTCPICGNKLYFRNFKSGYLKTCNSLICINRRRSLNSSFHNKDVQEKCRLSIKEKYGVSNPFNIPSVQEKCIINAQSDQAKTKRKNTNISIYGVDNVFKNDKIKQKIRNTQIQKYGMLYRNTKEYKDAVTKISLEKYGTAWPSQSNEIKEKVKKTFISHFGVDSYFKTKECKEKSKTPESLEKLYLSKRKNHTFNTSKTEEQTYNLLKERWPDTIRQYRSEKYPFNCDFYIPSIDLYIECNYHWTHGGHPYNEKDLCDQEKLKMWQSKNTKFYNIAINTWTVRDINKRKIAKQNNLNFIEIWNINELDLIFNKQYTIQNCYENV